MTEFILPDESRASTDVLYRAIAENFPGAAIFVVDKNFRYRLAEGPSLKEAGLTSADFEGKSLWEVLPVDQVRQHEVDYRAVFEGHSFQREHEINGQFYLSRGIPLRDASGNPCMALAVSYNITERKRIESRLHLLDTVSNIIESSHSPEDVMAKTAQVVVARLGIDCCIFADVDPESSRLCFGGGGAAKDAEHLCAQQMLDLVGAQIKPAVDQQRTVAWPDPQEKTLTLPNGIGAAVFCPWWSQGRLSGLMVLLQTCARQWDAENVAVAKDVATRAWTQIERLRMTARLQETDERKDQFLATLSHELRTPLSAIATGLALLKQNPNLDITSRTVSRMGRQVQTIQQLVDDLLDVIRINTGKIVLRRERIAINQVVAEALEATQPICQAHPHLFDVRLPDKAVYVDADFIRLIQVLTNLLHNAIKYSPAGSTIGLHVEQDNKDVIVKVQDAGIGISAQTLPNVFDMFVQDSLSHGLSQGGVGIGLTVAKKLVEAHGGSISAASPGIGQGSTFTICLPRAEGV